MNCLGCMQLKLQEDFAYRHEVQALRLEMKCCTEQIAKLNEEFTKMKKEVEAVLKEPDYTCCFLTDITSKNIKKSYQLIKEYCGY